MVTPTVHLNGSSAERLLDGFHEITGHLNLALDALGRHTPHDRDYYVQSPDAGPQARAEWLDRITRVESVLTEIQTLALAVYDQQEARRR